MNAARSITKAFQWDLARQVERLDFLLPWLPRYADWGYQELYLHLEDAVEYPTLPGVGRSDGYTYAQLDRLVKAATTAGIRVVPIVNLLGHTQYLIKVPDLRELNELHDRAGNPLAQGQICPLHPRTPEVAGKLLRDVVPFCTAGKVHAGLDESIHLGKCPRCREEIARIGLAAHFAAHVDRLHALTTSLGLRLGLWADMLALLPAAVPKLPRDVIVHDWYYYPFARLPRVELHNFAEVDLATPLRARGIEYWGCPMNGAFRHEPLPVFGERLANIVSWWRRCGRVGAAGFLVTSWEANRLAMELPIAIDAAAASLWLDPHVDDPREMLARGFARVFGNRSVGQLVPKPPRRVVLPAEASREGRVLNAPTAMRRHRDMPPYPSDLRRWARAALAGDAHAFCGYYRWQINERWDVCATRDGLGPYEQEEKTVSRICRSVPLGRLGALSSVERLARDWGRRGGSTEQGPGKTRPLPPAPCSLPPPTSPALRQARGPELVERAGRLLHPCPSALSASLAFRRYLAQRDVFVRRAAQAVFQLRQSAARQRAGSEGGIRPARHSLGDGGRSRPTTSGPRIAGRGHPTPPFRPQIGAALASLRAEAAAFARDLRSGRAAARVMWNRSRNPRRRGPNEGLLDRDAERLRTWRQWLRRAALHPEIIWQSTPVCGAWQLQFTVHHFAPAQQKVVVEQQRADGTWVLLHGLPLIEFRAFAARPRAKITREFSVPIPVAGLAEAGPGSATPATGPLRIALRGVGQVAISDIELTDGVNRLHPRGRPPSCRKILGRPSPRWGFRAVDFEKNAAAVTVTFSEPQQS